MIAKLERVPLREVWKHEAYDFTQWLEENIDILSEAIDLTLVNAEREKKTESTFSVDLVAEDENGATVIIENQLEKSDHDHLGKLITYLTAMQARTAIWIVAEPRPEHVSAIGWLNESSGADFYLLKIEAIRIGNSPPAPLLTVIVGPSEEGKSVGRTKQEISEREKLRHRFWSQLLQHPDAKLHKHLTPGKYAWIGLGSGTRGVTFNYGTKKEQSSVELYIDRGKEWSDENLAIFDQLYAKKDEIEKAFGGPLGWERLEGKRACRIRGRVDGGYRNLEEQWSNIHGHMTNAMNRLVDAIRPHLRRLKIKGALEDVVPEGPEPSP